MFSKETMKALALLFIFISSMTLASAQPDLDADRAALIKAEADFEKARAERGLEGWLSYFADDAANVNPGQPIVMGKAEMRKRLEKEWNPDLKLTWKPAKADVAASRDLGYTFGTWELTGASRSGDAVHLTGKYATVWKKQPDGSWKVVLDLGNVDPVRK
jgi:ketosteroid isomerase-like protein